MQNEEQKENTTYSYDSKYIYESAINLKEGQIVYAYKKNLVEGLKMALERKRIDYIVEEFKDFWVIRRKNGKEKEK